MVCYPVAKNLFCVPGTEAGVSMYRDTITLFNRKVEDRSKGSIWYPTVIKGVNLIIDRAAIVAQYGPETQDSAILNIRYTEKDGEILVAGKPWMPPKEWDQTEDALTFATGSEFDFFWLGEWTGGIVQDIDYTNGFYPHMNNKHDYVFAITSVSRLTGFGVLPHFEITGK